MRVDELTVERFYELKPYVDTLLLPIGGIGNDVIGNSFGHDLLLVRRKAAEVDQLISGRLFLLPEVVHTNLKPLEKKDDSFIDYVLQLLQPFYQLGFNKMVILYSSGLPGTSIASIVEKLKEIGFQVNSIDVSSQELNANSIVQKIISLWKY